MIDGFRGQHYWLAAAFPCPIWVEDTLFTSLVHAYQALKTDDKAYRALIRQTAATASEAKRLGKKAPLRPDWDRIKIGERLKVIRSKYDMSPVLASKLKETGQQDLINTTFDNRFFWGICRGKGYNYDGLLTMHVRHELRHGPTPFVDHEGVKWE